MNPSSKSDVHFSVRYSVRALLSPLTRWTGLKQEKPVGVNADHAGVAIFRSSDDPTFIAISQILHNVVAEIKEEFDNPERIQSQLSSIARYFGLDSPEAEDEESRRQEQIRVDGSCAWLLDLSAFKEWRDGNTAQAGTASIFWLSGDPGCGKSILAAHVASHLRDRGFDTSCYFFKHGDLPQRSAGRLLKSIAHQMAGRSASLRRSMEQMRRDDALTAETNDAPGVWKQLFTQLVLQNGALDRHQYLIIDSLDEANSGRELLRQLKALPGEWSVFITCRKDRLLERELNTSDKAITVHTISKEDTIHDIRTYLERSRDDLHVDDEAQLQILIQDLVERSKGSFLWTKLIVQELSNWWADDDIERVLRSVPAGMNPMYNLMIKNIMGKPNNDLARVILRWVICAIRPLTVAEIRAAVKIETSKTIRNPAKAIDDICGSLVNVSNDRVQVVHDTVRDYLFKKDHQSGTPGEFSFHKGSSHEKLAISCLSFLCTSLQAPQLQAALRSSADLQNEVFLDYASQSFSDHIFKSLSAEDTRQTDELLHNLQEFFHGPVLSWIHRQAKTRNLSILTRVGKNLKAYATLRANPSGTPNVHLPEILEWADDLIHLVTVFGRDLTKSPAAIDAIPRLCPSSTRIFREFGSQEVGLQVYGFSRKLWPDRISSAPFGRTYASALACCRKYAAVSLGNREIVLFYSATCEEARRIPITENAKCIQFAHKRDWVVASGRQRLAMYNYETGEEVWKTATGNEILTLMITHDDSLIVAVTKEKDVETFDISNGGLADKTQRLQHSRAPGRHPLQAHLSEELGLLALVYRNEELELYSWPSLRTFRGRIPYSSHIDSIAFNPAFKKIAMSSFDGVLCTIDLATMKRLSVKENVDASHLVVSTDGKTLVAGTKLGGIQVYDFETLTLMHEIKSEEGEMVALCFASNSLRLLDIRRHSFNVWEPAALVRRKDEEESTSGKGHSTTWSTAPSQLVDIAATLEKTPITALVGHHTADFVFCAREDGGVFVHESMKGRPKAKLFDFGRTEVSFLAWNQHRNLLASADNSGSVKLHEITARKERLAGGGVSLSWSALEKIPKKALGSSIRQVLLSVDGNFLVVSTMDKELVFSTRDGSQLISHDCTNLISQRSQKWAIFSASRHQLFEVQRGHSHMISWHAGHTPSFTDMQLSDPVHGEADIVHNPVHFVRINDELWGAYDSNPLSNPLIWRSKGKLPLSEPASPSEYSDQTQSQLSDITASIANVLGIYRSRLVYLSNESWICSLRVDQMPRLDRAKHHFPMPHYWRSASLRFLAHVTVNGDVVLAVDGDLVIVKQGLD